MNCWKWIDASMLLLLSLVKMHMIIICKHCVDCVTCLTGQRRLVWTSWQNTGQERSRREWRFLWGHCCLLITVTARWVFLLLLFLLDAVVVDSAPSEVIWLILITWSSYAVLLLTLWYSEAQPWATECLYVKYYNWRFNPVWHRMLYSCTHMATVGVEG